MKTQKYADKVWKNWKKENKQAKPKSKYADKIWQGWNEKQAK